MNNNTKTDAIRYFGEQKRRDGDLRQKTEYLSAISFAIALHSAISVISNHAAKCPLKN